MHKKIIPVFMLIATLTLSWTVPVYASEEYVSTGSFFNWAASGGSFIQKMIGYTIGKVCPSSPDTYHHASQFTQKNDLGCFLCICDYCRQEFIGYESDVEQSYKAQVSDLPATGLTSSGELIWTVYPTYLRFCPDFLDVYFPLDISSGLQDFGDYSFVFNDSTWQLQVRNPNGISNGSFFHIILSIFFLLIALRNFLSVLMGIFIVILSLK